jgi:hypothetical protein
MYFLGEMQGHFFYNLIILNHIHGDVMVDEAQNVEVQGIDGTFYLDDVLLAHFVAPGVLDDRHGAV